MPGKVFLAFFGSVERARESNFPLVAILRVLSDSLRGARISRVRCLLWYFRIAIGLMFSDVGSCGFIVMSAIRMCSDVCPVAFWLSFFVGVSHMDPGEAGVSRASTRHDGLFGG